MPGSMPPLDLSRQLADALKRIQRLERATAAPSGFDPNADPVVIGSGAGETGSTQTVIIGDGAFAEGSTAVVIGTSAFVDTGTFAAVAIGAHADAEANDAIAIGHSATANATASIALGLNATATKAYQIMLGGTSAFVEIAGSGLVLKDTATGTRYLVQITSGALVLNAAP